MEERRFGSLQDIISAAACKPDNQAIGHRGPTPAVAYEVADRKGVVKHLCWDSRGKECPFLVPFNGVRYCGVSQFEENLGEYFRQPMASGQQV